MPGVFQVSLWKKVNGYKVARMMTVYLIIENNYQRL
jgi:hypothetical protein